MSAIRIQKRSLPTVLKRFVGLLRRVLQKDQRSRLSLAKRLGFRLGSNDFLCGGNRIGRTVSNKCKRPPKRRSLAILQSRCCVNIRCSTIFLRMRLRQDNECQCASVIEANGNASTYHLVRYLPYL